MTDDLIRTGERVIGLTYRQRPAVVAAVRALPKPSTWPRAPLTSLLFFVVAAGRRDSLPSA
jgi:hypothetical protein